VGGTEIIEPTRNAVVSGVWAAGDGKKTHPSWVKSVAPFAGRCGVVG